MTSTIPGPPEDRATALMRAVMLGATCLGIVVGTTTEKITASVLNWSDSHRT